MAFLYFYLHKSWIWQTLGHVMNILPNPGIMQVKVQKGDFLKKALAEIEFFFLFKVHMNPSKAWNAKLEAGIFWLSKNLYNQCAVASWS